MITRFILAISSVLILVSLYSCDQCDDCGPLQKEPAINLKFINQDSLQSVEDSLLVLETEILTLDTALRELDAEIQFQNDSLIRVQLAISAGFPDLEEEEQRLTDLVDSLQTTFTEVQEFRIIEEEKFFELQMVETDILNGKLVIDSLVSIDNMTSFNFGTDSLESFRFPLSSDSDSTRYNIHIGSESYQLFLKYVRNFSEDERSRIEILVSDITISDHTFTDIDISCETCSSDETFITAFF